MHEFDYKAKGTAQAVPGWEWKLSLVNERFFFACDALAEHVIGPALIDQYNRDEDQGDDTHDAQCICRR